MELSSSPSGNGPVQLPVAASTRNRSEPAATHSQGGAAAATASCSASSPPELGRTVTGSERWETTVSDVRLSWYNPALAEAPGSVTTQTQPPARTRSAAPPIGWPIVAGPLFVGPAGWTKGTAAGTEPARSHSP